jgi:hypothetical protein
MVATRKCKEIYDMQASRRKGAWFNMQKLVVNNYALSILVLRSQHLLKVLTSIASQSHTVTDPQPNKTMGRLCFSTYAADMKECDAPKSNSTTVERSLTENILMTTSGASWASSTATRLTFPRMKFCLAATGIEFAAWVGAGVDAATRGGRLHGLGHWLAK